MSTNRFVWKCAKPACSSSWLMTRLRIKHQRISSLAGMMSDLTRDTLWHIHMQHIMHASDTKSFSYPHLWPGLPKYCPGRPQTLFVLLMHTYSTLLQSDNCTSGLTVQPPVLFKAKRKILSKNGSMEAVITIAGTSCMMRLLWQYISHELNVSCFVRHWSLAGSSP